MLEPVEALLVQQTASGVEAKAARIPLNEMMEGDVLVRVTHSSLNYKDGLAITGKAPVIRRYPMVPGIDFAGVVERSSHPSYKPGDAVLANGWGLGETHFGGLASAAQVKGEWLIPVPPGLGALEAMAVGTAGYTAMLAVMAIENQGVRPEQGPAIVTGASGGVGTVSIALLKKAGYHVIASTGRPEHAENLRLLGADEIIDRNSFEGPVRPLGKERWIAGVDSVGSHTLAHVLSQTKARGAIAACGLVQGMDLPTSVAPFILRGVSLLGIDSVYCPRERRLEAWRRIAQDLDREKLAMITRVIGLTEVMDEARKMVEGKGQGRIVVAMNA